MTDARQRWRRRTVWPSDCDRATACRALWSLDRAPRADRPNNCHIRASCVRVPTVLPVWHAAALSEWVSRRVADRSRGWFVRRFVSLAFASFSSQHASPRSSWRRCPSWWTGSWTECRSISAEQLACTNSWPVWGRTAPACCSTARTVARAMRCRGVVRSCRWISSWTEIFSAVLTFVVCRVADLARPALR